MVEDGNSLLQVDEVDEAVDQDILEDQAHLPAELSSCGLAHAKLIGDIVLTAGGGQLHDGDGHPFLCSEGWPHADILAHDMEGHLGDNIHEGRPSYGKGLYPLYIIPGDQDDSFHLVDAGGVGQVHALDGLEVVPQHPSNHGLLGGLIITGHMKFDGPV
ncbi:hypothetical protein Y1Q_0010285 [Alligator mississippiensis]|uniref:Uncharacterized protein n=1 Tax=Alligator mississippiensis TaxID=8496 RepID=A0A151NMX8_ALLMI|nr:hypothetical protein Y1Q_0010285 [Alligator mississippiensis]